MHLNSSRGLRGTLCGLAVFGFFLGCGGPVIGGSAKDVIAADQVVLTINDIDGLKHRPFALGEHAVAVLIFVSHDCPIANAFAPEIRRIVKRYTPLKVRFTLVYSDPDVTVAELRKHMTEFGHTGCTAVQDTKRLLANATGAEVTPEAVVIGSRHSIQYRGRIDDLFAGFGKRRREATTHDLRNALDAVLAGQPVAHPRTRAVGCYIPPAQAP